MNNHAGTTAYEKPVTLKNILRFALPTIAMSLFMSFYTMVDGLFVSNLIGTEALSAINLTAPVISLVTAISTMLATGGSAVIMKKVGEGKEQEAREDFTSLILVNFGKCGSGHTHVRHWICLYGLYFFSHDLIKSSDWLLHRLPEKLSALYSSYSVNEQLFPVSDCLRKICPVSFLFCRRRDY